MEERAAPGEPTPSVAASVYAEQVDSVFRQAPLAIVVNLVIMVLSALVLAPLSARPLLPCLLAMTALSGGRWLLWRRYSRVSLPLADPARWSRLATVAACLTGLVWGGSGAFLFPGLDASGQIFLAIVVGGLCAGSVVINASHRPTLVAFIMSAALPMAIGFLAGDTPPDRVLGAMAVLFAVALTLAGWRFGRIFAEVLRLRFELNEANQRLLAEMAERRATEAALHEAQKLEAVGHLTGGVAHDFNNLLTVVVGNATMLHDQAADPATRRRAAAILGIAERGARLIRQLLAFSGRRTLRPEPLSLPRRAADIAELLVRSLPENISVTVDVPDDLWPFAVDIGEFELALLNIAGNARDAMPDGGRLALVARNRGGDGGAGSAGAAGDFVAVTLSDTGTGMPETVRSRAFEPYFTTKSGFGSGLGLSQVYGFCGQSGGAASIDSEPGRGTAVTLLLPRAVPAPVVPPDVTPPPAAVPPAARILLVEDEAEVADATEELLRSLGFETRRAADGAAALGLIEAGAAIDLVLSDVVMPGGVNGLDLARTLRRQRPALPVVLVTGYSQYAREVRNEHFALLEKPYRRDGLAAALRAALGAPV